MGIFQRLAVFAVAAALAAGAGQTAALAGGEPVNWATNFQPAASTTMEAIEELNSVLYPIITLIVVLVLGLLIYVMWRFSEKRNPTPSRIPTIPSSRFSGR